MQTLLTHLKEAEQQLAKLVLLLPDLHAALDYHLHIVFPALEPGSSVDSLYLNYEVTALPGQKPRLISRSLSELITYSYANQQAPNGVPDAVKLYRTPYTLAEQEVVQGVGVTELNLFVKYLIHNLESRVKTTLEHFWKTPHPQLQHSTPKGWLSRFIRDLLQTENDLRRADSTLSIANHATVSRVLTSPSDPLGPGSSATKPFAVYGVGLKGSRAELDIPLQGLLVMADNPPAGLGDAVLTFNRSSAQRASQNGSESGTGNVILYSPVSGLEAFDSLHDLSLELQARLTDVHQREALLDYALLNDRERALSLNLVGYREITRHPLTLWADELINTLAQNVQYAWATARINGHEHDLEALAEYIDKALNASVYLNPVGILQTRYIRLLEDQLPTWLKQASDGSKQQWRRAVQQLEHAQFTSQIAGTYELLSSGHMNSVLSYARARLKQQIKTDHGVEVDPDAIFIATTEARSTGPVINPLNPSGFAAGVSIERTVPTITLSTTRFSLSQLALNNVGKLDITYALTAQVQDDKGQRHPFLTPAYIKALVRELDVGEHYVALIKELLIYDPELNPKHAQAQWRLEHYVAVSQAQLRLDILEARLTDNLAHQLSDEDASRALVILNYTRKNEPIHVNGKRIDTHALKLNGYVLPGLWVISTEPSTHLLCYTPHAPDSIWFRRAQTLEDLGKLLSAPALHAYILQHVSAAQLPYVIALLKRGASASKFELEPVEQYILPACYDECTRFALRNADEQTTSTWEANVQTAKDVVLAALDVIHFVLPLRIRLIVMLGRFIYTLVQSIDALLRSEKLEGIMLYYLALTHLTDAASEFAGSAVFGRVMRQRPFIPTPSLNSHAPSRASTLPMRLRLGAHYGAGIYEKTDAVTGLRQHYLKDKHNTLYRTQYDHLSETWRIIDERQPAALYRIAVTPELSTGGWNPLTFSGSHPPVISLPELIQKAAVTVDLVGITADTQGLYRLNNLTYIKQSNLVFEVRKGWAGRQLYLQVPGISRWGRTRYKVRRLASTADWEVKKSQLDTTRKWETLTFEQPQKATDVPSNPLNEYDTLAQYTEPLREMTCRGIPTLGNDGTPFGAKFEPARIHAYGIQLRMYADAQAFFKAYPPRARALLPQIPAHASQQEILKSLFDHTRGVIIGESHNHASSKKLLINNMEFLAKEKVKVLYLEHLQTDLHQGDLNTFFATGNMPAPLKDFLNTQDLGHRVNSTTYTYTQLVREAQRHGIRIQALDCVASYHPDALKGQSVINPRVEIMNYGASQIIRNDQTFYPRRWIALTGSGHANTYEGIPGLAELEGAISVRVEDVLPGSLVGLWHDPGFVSFHPKHLLDQQFIKNDFLLEVAIPNTPAPPAKLSETQILLKLQHPNHFMFSRETDQWPELIHHSSTGQIVHTPLQTDADGKLFINQPTWPGIHQKRYAMLKDLVNDLLNRGMTGKSSW